MESITAAKPPSYEEIIRRILADVHGPVPVDDLAAQILQLHPSTAKNPHRAALAKIREEEGRQLVYWDAKHILPLRLAFQNARYRIRLSREMVDAAALPFPDFFHNYLPIGMKPEEIVLLDSQGKAIPFEVKNPPHLVTFSEKEKVEYTAPVIILKEWFHSNRVYHKDHILVKFKDWEHGILQLEREKAGEQNADLIAARNHDFADILYGLLEATRNEMIFLHQALPTGYARMADKEGTPIDHWSIIFHQDPRMIADGFAIRYADSGLSPFERLLAEIAGQSLSPEPQKYSKEEAKRVFRFLAKLTHKPSIWREVEIQGKQTLQELDDVLRSAFQHDTSDHLSGFWKKVARGSGTKKRYREVDIATINPFEYGEGSDTPIAALELQAGDQLKYVYDFGDWIEHTLELRSIDDAEKGVRYPREVARNTPKYEHCVECQQEGKETVAKWICYTCSNEEQRDVNLCDQHASNHEDHYVDEILY